MSPSSSPASPSTAAPVVIAGGGPAGLLLASALIDENVPVVVVAPCPDALWPENHASWHEELAATELGQALSPVWPRVVMIDANGEAISLAAKYGLVDKEQTQARLLAKVRDRAELIADKVVRISHDDALTHVHLATAPKLCAALFVDATGAAGFSASSKEDDGAAPSLFQTALGGVFRVAGPHAPDQGVDDDTMVLMDWRPAPGSESDGLEPSFLYVMPHGEGEVFFEETILIGARRDPNVLRERLLARLQTRFDDVEWCTDAAGTPRAEHCVIPMNAPAQRPHTHAVFGAAAGAIHPATGYSVGWSARHAPQVAAAVRRSLEQGEKPSAIARAVDGVLWSRDNLRKRQLLLAGAEVLKDLSPHDVSDFFAAFFAQDRAKWMAFMTRDRSAGTILNAMWSTFAHAPLPLKRKMMRLGAGPLLRTLV